MLKNYLQLLRLDKPIGILLLLWPTLWALFIAANGYPSLITIIIFVLGVLLTRSAGCAINDYADKDFDNKVARTISRPLARGVINPKHAIILSVGLSFLAFILALIFLHKNTILLSIPALLIYLTYPYTKRFLPLPQAYLGIAYSFGILMGFMEILGSIPAIGYLLFLGNWFWIFGYDTIYAMVDKEDDLKIGIKTSAITLGRYVSIFVSLSYFLFWLIMMIIGKILNFNFFYYISLILAGLLLIYQCNIIIQGKSSQYFKMFLLNNDVGLVFFIGIFLNYWLKL